MKSLYLVLSLFTAALLAGCATAPKPLQGSFAELSPSEASSDARAGERVRWGGEIVAVETLANRSCFELLGKPLADTARPRPADESAGRFLACRDGFYDPALFEVGRDLTVVGTIETFETRQIGEYAYRYPRLAAEVVYLWPERLRQPPYPHGPWVGYRSPWVGYWGPHRHWWP